MSHPEHREFVTRLQYETSQALRPQTGRRWLIVGMACALTSHLLIVLALAADSMSVLNSLTPAQIIALQIAVQAMIVLSAIAGVATGTVCFTRGVAKGPAIVTGVLGAAALLWFAILRLANS